MSFSAPTFGLGLVLSALVATQVLTGAAAVPTQSELIEPAASVATGLYSETEAGQRIPGLMVELASVTSSATAAVDSNTLSSASIHEAEMGLLEKIRAAERLSPSAWLTARSDGAHLVAGEVDLLLELERDLDELRVSLTAWENAVAAHRTAEDARQTEAARSLATVPAAPAAPRPTTATPAPTQGGPVSSGYTISPAGTGGQALIDACVGPVWWTPTWFPYLSEHWHCGGAAFPRHAGAIITITGSGVYQSAGVVKQVNAYVEDMSSVPSGYDVYYQTCLHNDPSTSVVIGLMRIA